MALQGAPCRRTRSAVPKVSVRLPSLAKSDFLKKNHSEGRRFARTSNTKVKAKKTDQRNL